jgi:hypothetical protein
VLGKATKVFSPHNPLTGGLANTTNNNISAYENAARWVNNRTLNAIQLGVSNSEIISRFLMNNDPTGVLLAAKQQDPNINTSMLRTPPNATSMGLFLYNHIRSIESSPGAGSYGVTDTWLVLGTGVKYTEEFTWEVSVDDKWVHTVSMNGTIKGLEPVGGSSLASSLTNEVAGYTIMPPFKAAGYPQPTAAFTGVVVGREPNGENIAPPYIIANKFAGQNKGTSKYTNALHAYISGVKPFLYVRAGHALKTIDDPPLTGFPG